MPKRSPYSLRPRRKPGGGDPRVNTGPSEASEAVKANERMKWRRNLPRNPPPKDGAAGMTPSAAVSDATLSRTSRAADTLAEDCPQRKWRRGLAQLEDYKKTYGNCNVPRRFKLKQGLGLWVNKQRSAYKLFQNGEPSPITQERINELNLLGFQWHPPIGRNPDNKTWFGRLEELRAYKEQHGDCNVPLPSKTYKKLGLWVNNQRWQYKLFQSGKPSQITQDRINALNLLGFHHLRGSSNLFNKRWDRRLKDLRAYKEQHGHCNVPELSKTYKQLGSWVSWQRRCFRLLHEGKPSSITQDRIKALDDLGFHWSPMKSQSRRAKDRNIPMLKNRMELLHEPEQAKGTEADADEHASDLSSLCNHDEVEDPFIEGDGPIEDINGDTEDDTIMGEIVHEEHNDEDGTNGADGTDGDAPSRNGSGDDAADKRVGVAAQVKQEPRDDDAIGGAASVANQPSALRLWLRELDYESYASAFEREFRDLQEVTIAADRFGHERVFEECNVKTLGAKAVLELAISKLPRC